MWSSMLTAAAGYICQRDESDTGWLERPQNKRAAWEAEWRHTQTPTLPCLPRSVVSAPAVHNYPTGRQQFFGINKDV